MKPTLETHIDSARALKRPLVLLGMLLTAGCAHVPGPFGEVKPLSHPIQADEGPPIDRRDR